MKFHLATALAAMLSLSLCINSCGTRTNYNKFVREVLPNGLTLIIKYNPDSRVFAINILGKNRSAGESDGKDGITDFVNRMMLRGADGMSAEEVQNRMDDLGIEITANDIPYIPYDDRYTTRGFSFIKFETIDEYAEGGTQLLYQMVAKPDFPEEEIEKTKKKVMGLLGMRSGSTYQNARNEFYGKLFEGHPFTKTVMGTPRTVMGFTRDDLAAHHERFYAPGNMIMAIATNIDADTVKNWIYSTFGQMAMVEHDYPQPAIPERPAGLVEVHHEMDKEQIYIYLGGLTPGLESPDAAAMHMAASIISTRMKLNLREGFENYGIARDGLIAEINRMKSELPTEDELKKAQNSTWGSMLLARASRINQAFYMCKNEFLGVGYDYEDDYLAKIRRVTPADIQRVVNDYFDTENMVIATAGKVAG
jgi:predicted Zn-dependent peptidase